MLRALPSSRNAMSTRNNTDRNRYLLSKIGLSAGAERAYRLLLARGSATEQELSESLSLSSMRMQRLLGSLQRKGLVVCLRDATPTYLPIAPDLAIGALIQRRQVMLERVRSIVPMLHRDALACRPLRADEKMVEVVTGRTALGRIAQQLRHSTHHELRCLVRKPFTLQPTSNPDPLLQEPPARPVRYLTVLDHAAMEDADALVRARCGNGNECRIAQCVPFELMISDWRLAAIPLVTDSVEGSALLIRPSALLDGLCTLFDSIWQKAAPIDHTARAAELETAASPSAGGVDALLPLLAAGLNDKAIAHELGISVRTLIRRIADLLGTLDARTRFQAGWLAARRMHSEHNPDAQPAEAPQMRIYQSAVGDPRSYKGM